jgi:hypothetical protein
VKVDPKLGGQWKEKEKVLCLVANGRRRRRFFCLVANGRRRIRFFCLVANGRRRRRFLSTYSHFPPKQLYLNLQFLSFDIKVLLYHGPRPFFTHSLPFLDL